MIRVAASESLPDSSAVPIEVHFEQSNTLPQEKYRFRVFCAEGSIGTDCRTVVSGIHRRPDVCAPGAGPSHLCQEGCYKIVGVWKETASGAKDDRVERKEVLALAQAREIDVILVTELTRWGRSMLDLFHTLQNLQAWGVSLVAQSGLQFDLRSAQGKLIASLVAALAEFQRDLHPRAGPIWYRLGAEAWGRFRSATRSARQGRPFRAQSAETCQRRSIIPGDQS